MEGGRDGTGRGKWRGWRRNGGGVQRAQPRRERRQNFELFRGVGIVVCVVWCSPSPPDSGCCRYESITFGLFFSSAALQSKVKVHKKTKQAHQDESGSLSVAL